MNYPLILSLIAAFYLMSCEEHHFRFNRFNREVALYYDDQLITRYLFEDSLCKPVFYPVQLASGVRFNRMFPLEKGWDEPEDHLHHFGIWFSYGEVNGTDFWQSTWENNNGINPRFGVISSDTVFCEIMDENRAAFTASCSWKNVAGKVYLSELSQTIFTVYDNQLIVDRETKLIAADDIKFTDSKEGMYAIRVNSALQEDHTGEYLNSEGMKGSDVWGKKAKWVKLSGTIERKSASVLFVDHPKNPGYPTHWMARGYGLFAANPLGQAVYNHSTDSLNLSLSKGVSVTFRYRIVLSGYEVSDAEIDHLVSGFTELF